MSTITEDLRSITFKLCQQRDIPVLITDLIAGYLDDKDLLKINTVSREFNLKANASIYRDLVIELDGSERAVKKITLLFRTLLANKAAASAVRSISLAGYPLAQWREEVWWEVRDERAERPLRGRTPPDMNADLTHLGTDETRFYEGLVAFSSTGSSRPSMEVPTWGLCLYILCLAPNTDDLSVNSDYFRYGGFRSGLQDMADTGLLGKLQNCRLCLDLAHCTSGGRRHPIVVPEWETTLLAPFTAPALKSYSAVLSLRSEVVRQLRPGGLSVTRLVLHHYQNDRSDLKSLLAATPGLQYLRLHATTDYSWFNSGRREAALPEHAVGLDPLYDALYGVRDSLRELHAFHRFSEDSIHFPMAEPLSCQRTFRQRGELSTLNRLRTLTLPFISLLGWEYESYHREWDGILPTSLCHLTLTDNLAEHGYMEQWTDARSLPILTSLLEWPADTARRLGVTASFGLQLNHDGYEFNEPMRRELTRAAEALGVLCSIEKTYQDRKRPPQIPIIPRGRGRVRGRGRGT